MDDPEGKANIAYLEDTFKHIEHNTASNEVKIVRNKAQFKATQPKDKLSRPPPRKSTITEIITETQNDDGSITQIKHKGQLNAQAAISSFYNNLYAHNSGGHQEVPQRHRSQNGLQGGEREAH